MGFHAPEKYRYTGGKFYGKKEAYAVSDASYGNNGVFFIPRRGKGNQQLAPLQIICSDEAAYKDFDKANPGISDGVAWRHVSVSLPNKCPSWAEMCRIKEMFWDDEDTVIQYHPPKSDYVNLHPYCLHLWQPIGITIPRPPPILVGPKDFP